jgi:hypothetical protein
MPIGLFQNEARSCVTVAFGPRNSINLEAGTLTTSSSYVICYSEIRLTNLLDLILCVLCLPTSMQYVRIALCSWKLLRTPQRGHPLLSHEIDDPKEQA